MSMSELAALLLTLAGIARIPKIPPKPPKPPERPPEEVAEGFSVTADKLMVAEDETVTFTAVVEPVEDVAVLGYEYTNEETKDIWKGKIYVKTLGVNTLTIIPGKIKARTKNVTFWHFEGVDTRRTLPEDIRIEILEEAPVPLIHLPPPEEAAYQPPPTQVRERPVRPPIRPPFPRPPVIPRFRPPRPPPEVVEEEVPKYPKWKFETWRHIVWVNAVTKEPHSEKTMARCQDLEASRRVGAYRAADMELIDYERALRTNEIHEARGLPPYIIDAEPIPGWAVTGTPETAYAVPYDPDRGVPVIYIEYIEVRPDMLPRV